MKETALPIETHPHDQRRTPGEETALVDAVRSLPERFRTMFNDPFPDASGANRSSRRPSPEAATAIEHMVCVREALEHAGNVLERVAHDTHPVPTRAHISQPVAGYYRWSPEDLVPALAAETNRLARIVHDLTMDESLPEGTRAGLQMIAEEMLRQLMADAVEHLSAARLAMA